MYIMKLHIFSILRGWKHLYPIDINEQALLNKSVGDLSEYLMRKNINVGTSLSS